MSRINSWLNSFGQMQSRNNPLQHLPFSFPFAALRFMVALRQNGDPSGVSWTGNLTKASRLAQLRRFQPVDDNRICSEQAAQKQQLELHCTEWPTVAKTGETQRPQNCWKELYKSWFYFCYCWLAWIEEKPELIHWEQGPTQKNKTRSSTVPEIYCRHFVFQN